MAEFRRDGVMPEIAVTRVLLVEDDPGDAYLVVTSLRKVQFDRFDTTISDCLSLAIGCARSLPFDVVLLDLSLPDSRGMQTIRAFRQAAPDLPVIVLTGLEDRDVGLQALKEGCQDYLVKGRGDGETIARAILHSIARKQLENGLFRAKEEYRLLVETSPSAILVCTEDGVQLVNEAARQLCSTAAGLRGPKFASLVVSHDVSRLETLIRDVLRGMKRLGVVETQLHGGDGRMVEVEIVVLAVNHDSGPVAELIIHDLTARREADHYRTLASSVFDGSAEAMIVTDARTRVRLVNAAFTEITGYRSDEIIGQTPHLLASGKHSPEFYENMWNSLLTNGHWRGDIWNRRKNGEVYVQRLTISAIRGHEGTIENFVGVFSDVTEKRQEEDFVRQRAFHDALTGLPNRALMEDRLERAVTQAFRREGGLAVLFLDLDGFKPVNDRHGHRLGDELLRHVAGLLKRCVRESDTVARIGGDEFILLLTDIADCARVERIACSILQSFNQPISLDGITVSIGISIGIAVFPEAGTDPASLLANADKAMYAAKRQGKGVYCSFSKMDQPQPEWGRWEKLGV
ncbi:MAG: diguanylate cyclase [Alphaproteobacteria bacterium]|nr:diguanylate cyclase [Alphaproteobacteria bacterium]